MKYTVEHDDAMDTLVLHEERLDASNSADFKGELLLICRSGIEVLFVDLSEVEFCDSSGLSALLLTHREMKVSGGAAIFICMSPKVKSLIELTQLDRVLYLYDTREEAMADLQAMDEDEFDGE